MHAVMLTHNVLTVDCTLYSMASHSHTHTLSQVFWLKVQTDDLSSWNVCKKYTEFMALHQVVLTIFTILTTLRVPSACHI